MRQLTWNPNERKAQLLELPSPDAGWGLLRIRNAYSVISAGTERNNTQLSLWNPRALLQERPDLVQKVRRMAQSQGIAATVQAVRARVQALQQIGYSCAGTISGVGAEVTRWEVGERVACSGAGYAVHAEEVVVPPNLCVAIPADCPSEAAALAGIGAIAMHGYRLGEAGVGARVLVIGLGLIGQLAARIAIAAGCEVYAADLNPERLKPLADLGARCGLAATLPASFGEMDAVLVAAGSRDTAPLTLAAERVRQRGRVVAIGLFPLELQRELFYRKEAEFVVSRSSGPGRYDPGYEELGVDYPSAYVRWTVQRNMGAFLRLIADGRLPWQDLISHRFPIALGPQAYELLTDSNRGSMAILLEYPGSSGQAPSRRVTLAGHRRQPAASAPGVGWIGAGQFARTVLLPAFQRCGANLQTICTRRPLEGRDLGQRFGFQELRASPEEVIADPRVAVVVIATRHDSHAELTRQALAAGKAVFVEKPLALTLAELATIQDVAATAPLLVGYNRRFAPLAQRVKEHFAGLEDGLMLVYRANVGALPAEHWSQVAAIGGGRILGEACHFVDWAAFLTGGLPVRVLAAQVRDNSTQDDVSFTMQMDNGAVATVVYTAAGGLALPKERIEVFGGGRTAVVDDWQTAMLGVGSRRKRLKEPGKGHLQEVRSFLNALASGEPMPISPECLARTSEATFAVLRSLTARSAIALPLERTVCSDLNETVAQGVSGPAE